MRPPKRKTLSPPEKKTLSRAKDRRNNFGENEEASRKGIPLFKRRANRKVRHADRVNVERGLETADAALHKQLISRKRKAPDVPLGQLIDDKLAERTAREAKAEAAR